jgi:uncharacterized protein involved in type VI secretion and phage assembly
MSTSYPYLAIARRQNADYGLVLSFADMMKHYFWKEPEPGADIEFRNLFKVVPTDIWWRRAAEHLSIETKRLIICKVAGEDQP